MATTNEPVNPTAETSRAEEETSEGRGNQSLVPVERSQVEGRIARMARERPWLTFGVAVTTGAALGAATCYLFSGEDKKEPSKLGATMSRAGKSLLRSASGPLARSLVGRMTGGSREASRSE